MKKKEAYLLIKLQYQNKDYNLKTIFDFLRFHKEIEKQSKVKFSLKGNENLKI